MPCLGLLDYDGTTYTWDEIRRRKWSYGQLGGLPNHILLGLRSDKTPHSGADYSITQLLGAPRIQRLQEREDWYIPLDDAVKLSFGRWLHNSLENLRSPGLVCNELEVSMPVSTTNGDVVISGVVDTYLPASLNEPDGFTIDYKFVGRSTLEKAVNDAEWDKGGMFFQYRIQTSFYSHAISRLNNVRTPMTSIILLGYEKPSDTEDKTWRRVHSRHFHPLPLDDVLSFIRERVRALSAEELPECSPADQWRTNPTAKVFKVPNSSRAVPGGIVTVGEGGVLTSEEAMETANKIAEGKRVKAKGKSDYGVVYDPGTPRRCIGYCPVWSHCEQLRHEYPELYANMVREREPPAMPF